MLEAADSGAAPVFVAAYNHFAVEFLLLLLECVFHLLPFQSSIPGERVISERLQAGTIFGWNCPGQVRVPVSADSCPCTTCCQGTLQTTCPQRAPLSYLVLPEASPMALHCVQNSNSARNMNYSSTTTGDCLPASRALRLQCLGKQVPKLNTPC